MTWRDISQKTGRIKVIRQKTGTKIEVPLHRDLLEVLEKARHNQVSIVTTEYGKPFTVDGFSSLPGAKYDEIVVLESEQGTNKSSFRSALRPRRSTSLAVAALTLNGLFRR